MLFSAAMAASAPAGPPVEGPPIIVTGKRAQDTEAALRACLARKCPPDQDIDASLAHAENLFVAGDYRQARTILRRSLNRNGGRAADYPVPVSDLHRANALVANNLGFEEDYLRSTWGIYEALKQGIPEPDARHFGARMEIAAMTARLRGFEAAEQVYARLADDAEKGGRADIAAIARLRAAGLAYRRAPSEITRQRLRDIAGSTAPETKVAAAMAKLFLARVASEAGRGAEAEALVREVSAVGFKAPVLIHSPRYQVNVQELNPALEIDLDNLTGMGNPARRYAGNFDKLWIDVGFWVQPNGRVSDLEVLRKGGSSSWAKPLLRSIEGRLYAPAREAAYRMERYSFTSGYEAQTGTYLRQRSPQARVEYLDLTTGAEGARMR
jgi:hypothetical protein